MESVQVIDVNLTLLTRYFVLDLYSHGIFVILNVKYVENDCVLLY